MTNDSLVMLSGGIMGAALGGHIKAYITTMMCIYIRTYVV